MACSLVLLAAVDRRFAIGRNNALLYRVPEDMRNFRKLTTGNTVICGRRTLESFPNGMPLPNRETILLSRTFAKDGVPEHMTVARNTDEVLQVVQDLPMAYVIGGEQVYRSMYPFCNKAILTQIDAETQDADAFFPALQEEDGWKITEHSEEMASVSGLSFRFITYQKQA